MKKQFIFTLITLLFFAGNLYSQVKVGNNPTTIGTSSVLEIESTTKGVVLPRMTGAQMNAIASPVAGMYVFNTDSVCICQYSGAAWFSMCGSGIIGKPNFWDLKGNAGTVDGTNFLGTKDNVVMNFRVNNQKAGRIDHLLNNTFLGYQAGNSNVSGTNNIIIGHQAGLNNTASNNQFVGYQSGYTNSTGNWNTAAGYQSMYSGTSAAFNTGFGSQALYSNLTGTSNVALGYGALYTNTASNNTAIGTQALNKNTSGTVNTATGVKALYNNTTGSYNSAYGWQSLWNNTTGDYNTASGYLSLQLNSTGTENTGYGFAALYKNTTGNYNTGIGSGALDSMSTGSQNTGLGKSVMYFTTTGNNNTAAGYLTLSNNITGSNNTASGWGAIINTNADNNTAMGYQAGIANTTGTNNTFIGYNTNASSPGLINATAIGNSAVVGASNSLVLGGTGASAVNVGVGTTTPGASNLLDLVSTTKGFVMPRMTGVQMNAIASPVAGMQVYNTDSSCTCQYTGALWRSLCARIANEWLDKDSLAGYAGAAMIYAKQALTSSQDTVAVFDDGSWYHADPGINQFAYGNSARNNNLFNSTKIPAASLGSGYNFTTFNNQIDNTSNAAGNVSGISSLTTLPTTTARSGLTYGANIQAVINGSAAHTGPIYGANISTGVYGTANYGSIFGLQGFFADGLSGVNTVNTAYGANLQFYKGGTGGNYTNAYGSNNSGWLASGAGGTIGTLSGSRNAVNYPNGGVNNVTVTNANGGEYYVGLGAGTGTGTFGTVNGIYVGLNLAATAGNVLPVTTVNGVNIDFQSQAPDARITNVYGIKMNDVTRGGTLNYGIYTGLGKVSFGDNTEIRSTGNLTLPVGTTAQRPVTPAIGMTRYNSTLGVFEGYIAANWVQLAMMNATATPATTGTFSVPMTGITTYTLTPTGACTFNATGGIPGQYCTFFITATATTRTLTWGTNFKTTATLATGATAGKIFTVTFIYDGTNWAETGRTGPL